jgi:hypothetical protein
MHELVTTNEYRVLIKQFPAREVGDTTFKWLPKEGRC